VPHRSRPGKFPSSWISSLYLDRHIGRMLQSPAVGRYYDRAGRRCWLRPDGAYGPASRQAHDRSEAQHSQHYGRAQLRDFSQALPQPDKTQHRQQQHPQCSRPTGSLRRSRIRRLWIAGVDGYGHFRRRAASRDGRGRKSNRRVWRQPGRCIGGIVVVGGVGRDVGDRECVAAGGRRRTVPAVGHQPQERSNPRPWGGMTRVVERGRNRTFNLLMER